MQQNFEGIQGFMNKLAGTPVSYTSLATDAQNAFLKLDVAADKELRFGSTSSGNFPAANHHACLIPHGLGRTPDLAFVWANYIGLAATSTAQDEAVVCSQYALSATDITVTLRLTSGATTSAATTLYWAVIG